MFQPLTHLPMLRHACPLVCGLSLFVASGCASVGGRNPKLADRTPSIRSRDTKPADTDRSDTVVSFRPPRRSVAAETDPQEDSFSGHAPVLPSISSARSDRRQTAEIAPAGFDDRMRQTSTSDDEEPTGVIDAHYRSDRDEIDNPIQLQGLQTIADSSTDQPSHGGLDWAQHQHLTDAQQSEPTTNGITFTSHQAGQTSSAWQAELNQLIARAERELEAITPPTSESLAEYRRLQVHLRLLHLLARHPEQAITAIPSLDPADTEYWQEMFWAITYALDEQSSPRDRAAQTIPPLNNALRRLRQQADLSIRNSAFCEEISYFGNYKRFPREEFVPGQPVLLYAEIENFRSELSSEGEYRTRLSSLVEIVGPSGQIGWKKSFPATEDSCRNPRRDYFHNYQFTIPDRLPLGSHTLRLTVVDELSGKQATSTIKFVVK
jgi:hypothetical protein